MAATEQEYALTRDGDRLVLDRDKVRAAVARWTAAGKSFCLLGYTYLLYEYVVRLLADEGEPDRTAALDVRNPFRRLEEAPAASGHARPCSTNVPPRSSACRLRRS